MKIITGIAISLSLLSSSPALAQKTSSPIDDRSPYYMCFAYTPDGMFFAGGEFDYNRAQKMMKVNCGMSHNYTVVLLKTISVRKNGRISEYRTK